MKWDFGLTSDQLEEAPEDPVFLARTRSSSEIRRRDRRLVQEGPRKIENVSFGARPRSEATPELVSQDRGAERPSGQSKLTNTGGSFARRRWGLAAMPAPISVGGEASHSVGNRPAFL